ncbi:hypothetical protein F4818DRAFT_430201, partial [Hypoxylon cercidicola]
MFPPRPLEEGEQQIGNEACLDMEPKIGRALVFQQRMLWHSGQEVKRGEKFTVRVDLMYEHHFDKPSKYLFLEIASIVRPLAPYHLCRTLSLLFSMREREREREM